MCVCVCVGLYFIYTASILSAPPPHTTPPKPTQNNNTITGGVPSVSVSYNLLCGRVLPSLLGEQGLGVEMWEQEDGGKGEWVVGKKGALCFVYIYVWNVGPRESRIRILSTAMPTNWSVYTQHTHTASPGNTREVEEMMLLGAQRAAADGEGGGDDGDGDVGTTAALLGTCGARG